MMLAPVRLDDKYRIEHGRVFLTGVQALARLPMLQHQRDAAAGLNTAGYVSGYRGSPLAGLDTALHDAQRFLEAHDIRFHPGVNEDLAATAIWGTQQLGLFPNPKRDGIFAMWYGKGPGVDRCGDVFKHANYAGTARHGGVLLVAGDDHSARSSAVAHQSEHVFSACGIPVLAPASIQEYLDLGLHGWAMSRYSGCWVAMKTTSDTVESSATVEVDPARVVVRLPEDFILPADGVHIRWPDPQLAQEYRMQAYKVYAALAYARANGLNRLVFDSPRPRLGIIACGKAYLDARQALDDLGIDAGVAADIGLRLYKVGMPWPLEADGVRAFAQGLEEILVVEEKRQIIEYQLKEELYNWREDVRPRVVGKFDEGEEWAQAAHLDARSARPRWLLPPTGELTPGLVARAIATRIGRFHDSERIRAHLAALDAQDTARSAPAPALVRTPWFCPGCPHNRSTRVPEGACALGGVGCHLMAVWMDRSTLTISHMGGEGATWIGAAEHAGITHVFANMGDGTYYHSGLLAIRAAIAAGVHITYKILYNGVVAMTGGQPVDGPLSVAQITRQLAAEGVGRIAVVSEDPARTRTGEALAPGTTVHARDELDALQRVLQGTPGVTVLIYDQTCAAEKRRRRKRGSLPDPALRVFIHEAVCEGCGDCSLKSNCLSVVPVETPLGRKRAIDQHSCNKDYSCLAGACPSLVTVEGGRLRAGRAAAVDAAAFAGLPQPVVRAGEAPWNLLIAGVGGTGVVTIGALIGMAAHLEGKGVTVLDMTGLAQKGGAVLSHVRLAPTQDALHAPRIAAGAADALLACDLVVAVGDEALSRLKAGRSHAVVNTGLAITGAFVRNPDQPYPFDAMRERLARALGDAAPDCVDAGHLATRLMGNALTANTLLLGYAWQRGLVPVSDGALLRAIELNGVAVEENTRAFLWGRRCACDPQGVQRLAEGGRSEGGESPGAGDLDDLLAWRVEFLRRYGEPARVRRYVQLVERARAAEAALRPGSTELARAVTRAWFRLLAHKDEYEVARLYTEPAFAAALAAQFEGDYRVHYHFTPPLARRPDPATGEPRKRRFGPWLQPVLRLLARLRVLRGTPFDPFAGTAENRSARQLAREYEETLESLLERLDEHSFEALVELAALPEKIRGFGPVRERAAAAAGARRAELLEVLKRQG
ncbi:MAG: indolepyruvate ferredoxin oxidoreductase family protein [Rhodocyclaceae bacterium]|nr:indolepyruvate ferredoxin oxidoreductase family protein [Rhodocyclaceae bacterium]